MSYSFFTVVITTTTVKSAPFCPVDSTLECSVPGEFSLVPGVLHYKSNFHEACVAHDYCYRFGERTYGHTRTRCDSKFLSDMRDICNSWDWWGAVKTLATVGLSKGGCHGAAKAFHIAVSGFGKSAWNNSGEGSRFCEYHGPTVSCSSNPNSSCWTAEVSEERGGEMSCPQDMAISGIWCEGSYCDNKFLQCSPFGLSVQAQAPTKRISEEAPNSEFRVDRRDTPSILTGIKCTGDYCDKIVGKVGYSHNRRVVTKTTGWTPFTSEEQHYGGCPKNEFVTGIKCKGSYCDEISLHCSAFSFPQVSRDDLVPDNDHLTVPLDNPISTIRHRSSGKFADAHGSSQKDYGAVIRPAQGNDTQSWIFIPVGNGEYRIQQKSTGRYLDAYRSREKDYDAVTRPKQEDHTQIWQLKNIGGDIYTIQQKDTGRYLDSHEIIEKDFRMVTRPYQGNDSQRWVIRLQ